MHSYNALLLKPQQTLCDLHLPSFHDHYPTVPGDRLIVCGSNNTNETGAPQGEHTMLSNKSTIDPRVQSDYTSEDISGTSSRESSIARLKITNTNRKNSNRSRLQSNEKNSRPSRKNRVQRSTRSSEVVTKDNNLKPVGKGDADGSVSDCAKLLVHRSTNHNNRATLNRRRLLKLIGNSGSSSSDEVDSKSTQHVDKDHSNCYGKYSILNSSLNNLADTNRTLMLNILGPNSSSSQSSCSSRDSEASLEEVTSVNRGNNSSIINISSEYNSTATNKSCEEFTPVSPHSSQEYSEAVLNQRRIKKIIRETGSSCTESDESSGTNESSDDLENSIVKRLNIIKIRKENEKMSKDHQKSCELENSSNNINREQSESNSNTNEEEHYEDKEKLKSNSSIEGEVNSNVVKTQKKDAVKNKG